MSQPVTQELIEDTLEKGFIFLVFPRALEKEFQHDFALRYLMYRRIMLLLAAIIISLIGILDFLILAESWQEALVIRYAVAVPVLGAFFLFSWTRWFVRYQNITLTLNFCFIATMLLVLIAGGPQLGVYIYGTGVVLMIIYAGIMLRLTFWYALFCILFMIIGDSILLTVIRQETIDIVAAQFIFNFGAGFMATVAAYYSEHVPRHNFLTNMLLELEKDALHAANHSLLQLASQDGLTGIANRRLFDDRLREEWLRARRERHPVSLLLLDVDHFKDFNDTYGHQAGDDCLIVLASILKRSAKRPAELAARYGGEEFVVLLPNADSDDAMEVAERIRFSLESIGIPHTSSAVANVVTTSVGVACEIPIDELGEKEFIQHADEALYRAKMTGKNTVVLYNTMDESPISRDG